MTLTTREALRATRAEREQSTLRDVAVQALEGEKKAAGVLREILYASKMNAAFAAFRSGSIERARELLEKQTAPEVAAQRGFEWRWLWRQTRPIEQFVLSLGESRNALAVDFAPDGRRFLTFDSECLAVWATATRGLIFSNTPGSGYHARFSPDGKLIASTPLGQAIRLTDAQTGAALTNLAGHRQPVLNAVFSPDGRLLASAGAGSYAERDGEVFLWDANSWQQVGSLVSPGTEFIYGLAFSPDARTLAAGCGSGHVLRWDVPSRRLSGRLSGHGRRAMCVAFAPDGRRLVTAGLDHTVRLWDFIEQREIALLGLHEKGIVSVTISPNGRWAATAGVDHLVRVWNLDRPGLFCTLRGNVGRPFSVAFHPDNATLASAALDGTVRFWSLPSQPDNWRMDGVHGATFGMAVKRRLLLGVLSDRHVDVWDVATRERILHLPGGDAHWLPDSEGFVFRRDQDVIEYDLASRSERVLGQAGESPDGFSKIAGSRQGVILAWGHGDHMHVFDRQVRREIARPFTGERCAEQIAFSPNLAERTAAIFNLTDSVWRPQNLDGTGNYQTYNHASYGPSFGLTDILVPNSTFANGSVSRYSYGASGSPNILGNPTFQNVSFGRLEVFTIAIESPSVPDGGNTFALLGCTLTGLWVVARRRSKWQNPLRGSNFGVLRCFARQKSTHQCYA